MNMQIHLLPDHTQVPPSYTLAVAYRPSAILNCTIEMLQRMCARGGKDSRTPPSQCNHREAESRTVISRGRIQSLFRPTLFPSKPRASKPRDSMRNRLQESSEGTGNSEDAEARLGTSTREVGRRRRRGHGVGTSGSGWRGGAARASRSGRVRDDDRGHDGHRGVGTSRSRDGVAFGVSE